MIEPPESDIRELRGYSDAEYRDAIRRLIEHPAAPKLIHAYFPGAPMEAIAARARGYETVDDFQAGIISPAIESMLKQTSGGISLSGIENVRQGSRYLYLSNHRDIILDAALLTQRLCVLGHGTPKICLGDNLLGSPLVVDLIKMNKGVTVKRGLAPRELLRWSHALSELIRRSIVGRDNAGSGSSPLARAGSHVDSDRRDSVWIAQREGRTKDGNDLTQPGVLKMLAMAGEGTRASASSGCTWCRWRSPMSGIRATS